MMMTNLGAFGAVGFLYALILPLILMQVLAFLFIPSILNAGAKPMGIGKAIFAYSMQTLGIIMMTMGSLPALIAALSRQSLSTNSAMGFLILFAMGGLVFLLHQNMGMTVDEPSRSVVHAIYFFMLKIIGATAVIFSSLSLLLMMLFGVAESMPHWWVAPVVFLGYGLLLSWCTRLAPPKTRSMPSVVSRAPSMPVPRTDMKPSMMSTPSMVQPKPAAKPQSSAPMTMNAVMADKPKSAKKGKKSK